MSERQRIRPPAGCGADAAPYLLGALEPGEARAFVSHMEGCAVCRDEVAALAPVLDALPSPGCARPVPRAVRRRVLRAVRAEPKPAVAGHPRRIRGPMVSPRAGGLALGLAVVAAALVVGLGSTRRPARIIPATVGQAELRLAGGHGELVVQRLPPLPADRTYELWLVTAGGRAIPSTLFGVTSRATADLGVPGDLHGVSRLLVTVEPRGGSVLPTTRAVIQLPLDYVRRT